MIKSQESEIERRMIKGTYSDPSGKSWALTFEEEGIRCTLAENTVEEGIMDVYQALNEDKIFFFHKARCHPRDPKLVNEEGAKPACTVEEFPSYCWDPKKADKPIKKDDQGMDMVKYFWKTKTRNSPAPVTYTPPTGSSRSIKARKERAN